MYDTGIAYHGPAGVCYLPWENIRYIYTPLLQHTILGIRIKSERYYQIIDDQGQMFTITSKTERADELFDAIRYHTYPLLYQNAFRNYHNDETVEFGALRLSREEGMILAEKKISWQSIKHLSYQQGELIISSETQTTPEIEVRLPVTDLYNIEVLLSLLQSVCNAGKDISVNYTLK